MTDTKKLKSIMVLNGLTNKQMADKVGINPATFSRKFNGEADWTASEISVFYKVLRIDPTTLVDIFFV